MESEEGEMDMMEGEEGELEGYGSEEGEEEEMGEDDMSDDSDLSNGRLKPHPSIEELPPSS